MLEPHCRGVDEPGRQIVTVTTRTGEEMTGITIRRMTASDIAGADLLIRPQNWNQTDEDWQRFLALEPHGCFVAVADGRVVATTTTEVFSRVGWIGMVTVAPELRGRGLGRMMVAKAIAYLRGAGARAVKLDATPMGKPLYSHMGFEPEYGIQRYMLDATPRPYRNVTPCDGQLALWDEVLRLDRAAYRVDRSHMLRHLAGGWPELAAVHENGGQVDGYVLGRHGVLYEHIGPLVARSDEAASALFNWALSLAAGRTVILDCPRPNDAAVAMAERSSGQPLREFTRMHLGLEPYLDDPRLIFATSGAEKG